MTYHDIEAYPHARVSLDRLTDALFALDHQQQTATFVRQFPRETPSSGSWQGVRGELELAQVRLMGYPFNGNTAYRLVPRITR